MTFHQYQYIADDGNIYRITADTELQSGSAGSLDDAIGTEPCIPTWWVPRHLELMMEDSNGTVREMWVFLNPRDAGFIVGPGNIVYFGDLPRTVNRVVGESAPNWSPAQNDINFAEYTIGDDTGFPWRCTAPAGSDTPFGGNLLDATLSDKPYPSAWVPRHVVCDPTVEFFLRTRANPLSNANAAAYAQGPGAHFALGAGADVIVEKCVGEIRRYSYG